MFQRMGSQDQVEGVVGKGKMANAAQVGDKRQVTLG
jgi:hypothetical protein